jgi:hypothetical protein
VRASRWLVGCTAMSAGAISIVEFSSVVAAVMSNCQLPTADFQIK